MCAVLSVKLTYAWRGVNSQWRSNLRQSEPPVSIFYPPPPARKRQRGSRGAEERGSKGAEEQRREGARSRGAEKRNREEGEQGRERERFLRSSFRLSLPCSPSPLLPFCCSPLALSAFQGEGGDGGGLEPQGSQYQFSRSRLRYWMASAIWAGPMSSAPARSAIVRATLSTRSYPRPLSPSRRMAASSNRWLLSSMRQ